MKSVLAGISALLLGGFAQTAMAGEIANCNQPTNTTGGAWGSDNMGWVGQTYNTSGSEMDCRKGSGVILSGATSNKGTGLTGTGAWLAVGSTNYQDAGSISLYAPSGITLTGPTTVAGTLSMSGNTISNVAAGVADTDAANMSQLNALQAQINDAGTALVQQAAPGADLTVGVGTDGAAVNFANNSGATRTLSNVTAGVADTDAVNISQLNATNAAVADNASSIGSLSTSFNSLSTTVDGNTSSINNLSTSVAGNTSSINNLSTSVSNLSTTVDGNTTSISNLSTSVTNMSTTVDSNTNSINNLSTTVAGNSSSISNLSTSVNNLSTTVEGNTTSINNLSTSVNSITNQINNGEIGLVQQAAPGADLTVGAGKDGAAVSFANNSGATRTLSNVTAGVTDTDAVNMSQLNATNAAVTDNTNAISNLSTSVTSLSTTVEGNTTSINNLSTSVADNTNSISNLSTSFTSLSTTVEGNTTSINNLSTSVADNTTSISNLSTSFTSLSTTVEGNTTSINNLSTSVADNTASITNLSTSVNNISTSFTSLSTTVEGNTTSINNLSTSVADNTNSITNISTSLTNLSTTVADNTTSINNLSTSVTSITNQINNGELGLVTQDAATRNVNVAANADGMMVNFTGTAGARILNGVAAGEVSATSLQAVNGAQMHALASSTAAAMGGGSTVNPDGSITTPTYNVNGTTVNNIGDAVTNIDTRLAQNTSDISIINTTLAQNATNITNLQNNVAQNTTDIANNTAQINKNTSDITQITTALNDGSVGLVQQDQTTHAITVAKSLDGKAVDMTGTQGARTVTGVAAGAINADSTDAVNGAQLHATNLQVANLDARVANMGAATSVVASQNIDTPAIASGKDSLAQGNGSVALGANSVAIGSGSIADQDNTLSIGSQGNERRITNVAAGMSGTDAVNMTQLNAVQSSVNTVAREAYSGVAAAMAMPNFTPTEPGTTLVSAGVANYKGYTAMGVGGTYRSRNSRWLVNAAASLTPHGDAGVRGHVGYQF